MGSPEDCEVWERSFASYADRHTSTTITFDQEIQAGYQVAWGWMLSQDSNLKEKRKHVDRHIGHTKEQADGRLQVNFHTMAPFGHDMETVTKNYAHIEIASEKRMFAVHVPACSPEHIVCASCASKHASSRGDSAYWISNDTRFLRTFHGNQVNPSAIYGLLQYGAVPAPSTIDTALTRVPGGYTWQAYVQEDRCLATFTKPNFSLTSTRDNVKREEARREVNTTLDDQLASVPSGSALFFSGGVDSSLLAWRLAQQGRTDVTLLNYTFGASDEEAALARAVANRIGLPLIQIEDESTQWGDVLARIGENYTHPFGDYSLLPTNMLAHAAARQLGSGHVIIDGTGADGAFGLSEKLSQWKCLYFIPKPIRHIAGFLYKAFGLWNTHHRTEYVLRVLRRSTTMPMHQAAVIAQNPMDGIAYQIPQGIRTDLLVQVERHIQELVEELPETEQFSFLDLSFVCAGIFAAKSFDPLRMKGIGPVYPFLEPDMIRTSLSLPWSSKSWGGEPKALLKQEIAKILPDRWIYRRKSGFVPPIRKALGDSSVQAILQERVLSVNNPVIDFVDRDVVSQMVKQVRNGNALADQTYNFLWSFCMVSLWLDDQ